MQHIDYLDQLLEIHQPWQVSNVLVSQSSKRLDIFIGFGEPEKKGLFGFSLKRDFLGGSKRLSCPYCQTALPRNGEFEIITVRHLPIAGFATYLHVPSPGTVQSSYSECSCMRSWEADGTLCTIAMRDYIVSFFQAGTSLKTVAQLTYFSEDELMAIRQSANIGASPAPFRADAAKSHNIPNVDHQKWQQLIKGDLAIQTQFVALNLLLHRLRREVDKSPDVVTSVASAEQLYKFFVRNQKVLKNEIDQINL